MNILITGASKGIGFQTALKLAQQKGHRVLALSRSETGLQQLQAQAPDKIVVLPFDLTKPDWQTLLSMLEDWNELDVLVNNAGRLVNKPFLELKASDWHEVFGNNFFSVIELIKQLLPYLQKSAKAHIVNIGSMGGFQGSSKFPGLAAYSASKAALANLTECLAEEFKDQKIAVNCLAFGAVQTEMLEAAFPGYQAPLSSEEMAEWVAWFCINGQQFFNGKILPVSVSTP